MFSMVLKHNEMDSNVQKCDVEPESDPNFEFLIFASVIKPWKCCSVDLLNRSQFSFMKVNLWLQDEADRHQKTNDDMENPSKRKGSH